MKPLVREHRGHFVKMANIFCKFGYLCYLCAIPELKNEGGETTETKRQKKPLGAYSIPNSRDNSFAKPAPREGVASHIIAIL